MRKIVIIFICFLILFVTGCDDGNVDNSEFVTAKEETVSQEIDSLHLEWSSGVITINKGDSNDIHIEEKAKEDFLESNMFTSEVNGTELKVSDPHYDHPVIMLEHDITLTVPDKLYNEIKIDGTSVQIDMEDFKATSLNLDTNTTEHNISGSFDHVNSEFTSGVINYNFNPEPKDINLKGYVSEGSMILPPDSSFTLKQELDDSQLDSSFDLKETGENTFVYRDGITPINVSLEQSSFEINYN